MNLSHDETNESARPDKAMSTYPRNLSEEGDCSDTAPNTVDENNIETLPDDQQIGQALRSAYQSMLDEAIPEEMLDLLNKLD